MQIGTREEINPDIVSLGFDIRSEITLLGLIIENDTESYKKSMEKVSTAIRREINFWIRFNLSLPGRIAISKAMMYSQINYLGCFLPFDDFFIAQWSDLIENFVLGPLNISKARRYLSREEGGLGLFEIKTYLASQKCNWVKRAKNLDDNWKQRLYGHSYGNIFNIRSSNFQPGSDPILFSIAQSYELLLFAHTVAKENCKKSFIFENNSIFFMNPGLRTFDTEFFGEELLNAHPQKIRNLTVSEVVDAAGRPVSHQSFCNNTGIGLTDQKYRVLRDACISLINRNEKVKIYDKTSCDIQTFLCRVKSGSKHIRKILGPDPQNAVPHNLMKFSETVEIVIDNSAAPIVNGFWGKSFLDNSTRAFLFKLHNNILGINTRLSHFVRNHSRICTFCNITRNPIDEDETPLHLFFQCRSTEPVVLGTLQWIINDDQIFGRLSRQHFFGFFNTGSDAKNHFLQLASNLIKKYIWDCKCRFGLPNLVHCQDYIREELDRIISQNTKIRKTYFASGFDIHRE
jgi:hypothetical protein